MFPAAESPHHTFVSLIFADSLLCRVFDASARCASRSDLQKLAATVERKANLSKVNAQVQELQTALGCKVWLRPGVFSGDWRSINGLWSVEGRNCVWNRALTARGLFILGASCPNSGERVRRFGVGLAGVDWTSSGPWS